MYAAHVSSMNDEMVAAMNRLMTVKDDVASALDRLKHATRINGQI